VAAASTTFDSWIARRHPVGRDSVTVLGKRVYILPTRSGWLYALLVAVMMLGANHYANNMAFMLTFLLTGLGLNAMWRTAANIKGVVLRPGGAVPVFAGQRLRFVHEVENPSGRRRDAVMFVAPGGDPVVVSIPACGVTIELPVPAELRGPHREGRLLIATSHPMGLFRAWSYAGFDTVGLVWPKPTVRAPAIPTGGDDLKSDELLPVGEESEADHGDLSGLQPYRLGDPPHRIAWKAVARTGTMVSKSFSMPPGGSEAWADWFTLEGLDTEARLSVLCRWLLDCGRQGRPCGLRIPGATIPPDTGDEHLRGCLDRLAHYGRGREG